MKKVLVILLALVMVFSLAACGGGGGETKEPKELVIAIEMDQQGMDPQQVTWTDVPHLITGSPLFSFNKDNTELVPEIAESIEVSEDGMRIDFTLPEGAKFSNGDDLTAEAVKKSFMRMKEISVYGADLDAVTDVEVTDERHGALILSEPAPYMYASAVNTYGAIVDVAVAEEIGDDAFNTDGFVSCGPYKLESWTAGSEMTFVPNEYYKTFNPDVKNKDASTLYDKVTVRFIPDGFTRVSELQAGNVDFITSVGLSDYATILGDESLTAYTYDYAGMIYTMMNVNDEITGDLKVRQALALALNRDGIAEALGGAAITSYGFLNGAMIGYSADEEAKLAKEWAYDPEKAAALLEEAGWKDEDGDGIREKDGKKLHITYEASNNFEALGMVATIIQEQYKQVGIELEVSVVDKSVLDGNVQSGKFQMASKMFGWNDADILIYLATLQADQEVFDALVAARYTVDPQERVKKYEEASEIIAKNLPAYPIGYPAALMASRGSVKVNVYQDGRYRIEDIEKTE